MELRRGRSWGACKVAARDGEAWAGLEERDLRDGLRENLSDSVTETEEGPRASVLGVRLDSDTADPEG